MVANVAEFVEVTHKRTRGQKMETVSINYAHAVNIASGIDWNRMRMIADSARDHLASVQAELELLRLAHEFNAERMRRRAILFGIATPNRDEVLSISWALMAENYVGQESPHAIARREFATPKNPRAKAGFYTSLQRTLEQLEIIGDREEWSTDQLEQLHGVGPKVARMIKAVLEPSARSWTVDLWHQRQLLWASGYAPNVRCTVTDPAYKILEGIWLEYAERFFPGVDMFAVQWATWCAADGKFCSHADLWRDLAA